MNERYFLLQWTFFGITYIFKHVYVLSVYMFQDVYEYAFWKIILIWHIVGNMFTLNVWLLYIIYVSRHRYSNQISRTIHSNYNIFNWKEMKSYKCIFSLLMTLYLYLQDCFLFCNEIRHNHSLFIESMKVGQIIYHTHFYILIWFW